MTEVRDLNAEVVENATKVQTALRLSEDDQATINGLKQEIEQAWKLVDATKEKEARTAASVDAPNARWLTWSAPPSRARSVHGEGRGDQTAHGGEARAGLRAR